MNTLDTNVFPLLQFGDEGDNVVILQDTLRWQGCFIAPVTGTFDRKTQQAVLRFQQNNNLEPTGIMDTSSWQLLNQFSKSVFPMPFSLTQPTLQLGDTGEEVKELQAQLKDLLYYNGEISGVFDAETQAAVKRFQSNNRLTADGVVGRDTWAALSYLYSPMANCEDINNTDTMYTVKAGDTLYSIARKFNMSVDELKQVNHLTTNTIHIGQQLIVSKPTTSITYVVKAGDSLYAIARKFNTTVDEIKALNHLTSNTLQIGQELVISNSNALENNYTVKAGDTLYAIARNYNVTVDALMKANNLTSNTLFIGQVLRIPTSI